MWSGKGRVQLRLIGREVHVLRIWLVGRKACVLRALGAGLGRVPRIVLRIRPVGRLAVYVPRLLRILCKGLRRRFLREDVGRCRRFDVCAALFLFLFPLRSPS